MNMNLNSGKHADFELKNLTVNLYGRSIIEDVSFRIEEGKIGVLLGSNGAGKTSLIKAIVGLVKPAEGEIYIGGLPVSRMKRRQQAQLISYVPQYHLAVYNYTVQDFIIMGRTPHLGIFGTPGEKDLKIVYEVMQYLGIMSMEKRSYLSLSAGERQMVLLARSLVQSAQVVVMDEPTTYLDYQKQYCFLDSLKKFVEKRGITAIISLHDPNLALKFADKIIMIHDKKVLFEADCKSGNYISKLNANIKKMYGEQVEIKKLESDAVALWK